MLEKDGEDQLDRCVRNEVLHRVQEERNILHNGRPAGLVTSCVGTAF